MIDDNTSLKVPKNRGIGDLAYQDPGDGFATKTATGTHYWTNRFCGGIDQSPANLLELGMSHHASNSRRIAQENLHRRNRWYTAGQSPNSLKPVILQKPFLVQQESNEGETMPTG